MPAENYANVWVLNGSFGPGATIPGGTTFTESWVAFLDPGSNTDQFNYTEGETGLEVIIGGTNIGTPPLIYNGSLETNAGTMTGKFFVFAGQTYFFPTVANQNTTQMTATSITSGSVNGTSSTGFNWEIYTVPHNAQTFVGDVFYESFDAGGALDGSGVTDLTVYDYDSDIEANNGLTNQSFLPGAGTIHFNATSITEGTAVVSTAGGIVSGLSVVQIVRDSGGDDFYYAFDPASLTTAGITLADIIGVGSFTAGDQPFDSWTQVGLTAQPLTYLGSDGVDTITGTALNDTLNGEGGNDIIDGGSGADNIYDGAGDDIVNGGSGSDNFWAGAGADTYTGGSGFDEIRYDNSTAGVTVYMDGVTAGVGGYAEGDIIGTDIYDVYGSDFGDTIYGNIAIPGFTYGQGGNDILFAGRSTTSGGDDDDTIVIDTDYYVRNFGAEIRGDAGTDTLELRTTTDATIRFASFSSTFEAFVFDLTGTDITLTLRIEQDTILDGDGLTMSITGDSDTGTTENIILDMSDDTWNDADAVTDLSGWVISNWDGDNTISVIGHIDQANTITGTGQNDILWSGTLDDTLTGGAGNDTASYANATAGVTVNLDDSLAQDTLGAGTDTLSGIENITGSDFDDVLYGSISVTNILRGGDGNDLLLLDQGGFSGSATVGEEMYGGAGDDILGVAHGGVDEGNFDTGMIFDGGDGNDTITFEYATGFAGFHMNLASGDFIFSGTDYGDLISIESVNASAGNDLITMSSADNTIDGNGGSDTVSYSAATSGVSVDLSIAGAQDTGFGMDTFIEVENVTGSDFADTLMGNAEDNTLDGGAGDDTFISTAPAGVDSYIGGMGTDTLDMSGSSDFTALNLASNVVQHGGSNHSIATIERFLLSSVDSVAIMTAGTYHVDGGGGTNNVLDFSNMTSVNIDLSGTIASQRAAAGQTYENFHTAIGTSEGDILRGLIGEASTLDGGDGDDFFYVDDTTTIMGGAGYDRVIAREGSGALNYNLNTLGIEQVTGTAFADTFNGSSSTVAVKLFGGYGNDILSGSNFGDILDGNQGDDQLYGFAGDDRLDGLQGADTMDGGAGDDVIYIDQLDTIQGGIGYDRVFVRGYAVGVNLDLGATGIEFANGNIRADIFDASTSTVAVKLLGQRGDDTLTGSDFDDFISGGLDDDILIGNGGNDIMKGAAGADSFDGGAGDDKLFIDADDTSVIGGTGYDRVFVTTSVGVTLNMTAGQIEYASGNGGADTLSASGQTAAVKILGRGGDDFLIGGSQADLLYGGDGVDRLLGGNGDDFLSGGTGNDTFVFSGNWGDDRISDFDATNGDIIEMDSLGITFADLMISTVAGGTLVEYGTNSILLSGVNIADVDAADFSF